MRGDDCRNCGGGIQQCRVPDPLSPYCSACGATWGQKVKPVEPKRLKYRVIGNPEPSGFGRVSDGSLNQHLKRFGIKGVRKPKAYAAVAGQEREWQK